MKLIYQVINSNYSNISEILKCELLISNRLMRKLIKNDCIFLNDKPVSPKIQTNIDDIISVLINFNENSDNIVPTEMELDIIYEDESYIIINKPSGIPVHPSMNHYTDSLSNGLKYYFNTINLLRKIRPVNRIDKDTSGLVVFAKNEYIQECFIKQMSENKFNKEYIAICDGIFTKSSGTVQAPIARKQTSIIERCVQEDGDMAITHYNVIQENTIKSYSVVKCILETGRTHQIRVHMQYLGHPLLGDTLYGTESAYINRQALHAYKLSFIHPVTKKAVEYIAPVPSDIQELLTKNSEI